MTNEDSQVYRDAFAEASLELKELFGKIEQLNMRKEQIEQVVKVLGRRIGAAEVVPSFKVRKKTHLPGLTVVTRLTVFEKKEEAGK